VAGDVGEPRPACRECADHLAVGVHIENEWPRLIAEKSGASMPMPAGFQ
jgi:hypothetical protein